MACAAGNGGSNYQNNSSGTGGDDGGTAGTASGSSSGNGTGGTASGMLGTTSSGGSGTSSGHVANDAGSCLRIASIGHEGVWGPCNGDSTTAFQNWLNTESTAVVTSYDTTQPMLTDSFLAQYDVIILQWMVTGGMKGNEGTPWVFSTAEVTSLQNWVNAGGGLIVLTGYNCDLNNCTIQDTVATNQLLAWTDLQLNNDDTLDGNKSPNNSGLGGEGGGTCWGTAVPLGAAEPPAVTYSVGTWSATSPIAKYVTEVGAFSGRSIKVNNSSKVTVDATDGTLVYSAHESIGKGQVIVYGDEWITYTGEWTGSASCITPSNCMNPPRLASNVFQISQFWYNAIKLAGSAVACTFHINGPGIMVY
jgi:hypothetical protein